MLRGMRWLMLTLLLAATCSPANAQSQPTEVFSDFAASPSTFVQDGQKKMILPPAPTAETQNSDSRWLAPGDDPQNTVGWPLLKRFAQDQKDFWTSWRSLDREGATELAFFAGFTGALVASDNWLSQQIPDSPGHLHRSEQLSQYATYSLLGVTGASFLWGELVRNDRLRETGFLGGEAAINALAASFVLQKTMGRERPYEPGSSGQFFQRGNSFPSNHSAVAWSVASVVAHEYPGPLTKFLAYGLASTVTMTRVTSQQHFASDALVGSALGWYFARQVYRAHHDPELGGAAWGGWLESDSAKERNPDAGHDPASMASPYVPLDSWVYAAFDRLAALGLVTSGFSDMRPWTRMECARILEDAEDGMHEPGEESRTESKSDAAKLYQSLRNEFFPEMQRFEGAANLGMSVDSVYSRVTNIAGKPLNDGYHFGQTIVNDFGRPYGGGWNAISGLALHTEAGRLAFFLQGEYQHAPALPSDPPQVLAAIASADSTGVLGNGRGPVDHLELLDSAVSLKLIGNLQASFGKQSLWLGPGAAGPLLFSDNAEPVEMLRIDSVSPYQFPLLSRIFGPARSEFFLGQLSGQHWVNSPPHLYGPVLHTQPFLHGSKLSFKPTGNLEFGFSFTAQFAGPGLPFTWHNFLRTFYSHRANTADDPAKRLSAFDLNYRIPRLRNWLEFYTDSLVIDEYSPIGSTHPSINPGIYLPQIPKLRKLDFRLEGIATDLPTMPAHFGIGAVYSDSRYRSGYTNGGMLMGDWIGRMGRGEQGWSTYWLSAHSKLQWGYRQQDVNRAFIGGGHLQDFSMRAEIRLRDDFTIASSLQYEKWLFPVLVPGRQHDLSSTLQFTWWPGRSRK